MLRWDIKAFGGSTTALNLLFTASSGAAAQERPPSWAEGGQEITARWPAKTASIFLLALESPFGGARACWTIAPDR